MTNGSNCNYNVESKAMADGRNDLTNLSSSPHITEARMSDEDATVTVSRDEWQKLMSMLQSLSANQAELMKNQAELIAQLARSNERVKELEQRNEGLLSKRVAPKVLKRLAGDHGQKGSVEEHHQASQQENRFEYVVKDFPSITNKVNLSPPAENAQTPPRKTWAQIAAEKSPNMGDVSKATQEGIRKCLAMLDIQSPQPKPTALYFRNIRRARLGQVRKALRQMFTHPWAILGLSFIGKSVIEIVCHEALVNQIVAKLRLTGASHIKSMDVFGDNLKKLSNKENRDRGTLNLERAQKRFERLVQTCTNPAAKSWYNRQAQEAERRLAGIYQRAHDVETSVSDESGYDSNEVEGDVTMNPRESESATDTPAEDAPAEAEGIGSSGPDIDEELEEIQPVEKEADLAREAPQQL